MNEEKKYKFKICISGHGCNDLKIIREECEKIKAFLIDLDELGQEKFDEVLKNIDALIAGAETTITDAQIKIMNKCKIIVSFGVGFDHIDIEAATRRGIVVTNVPDYGPEEVANQAFALLINLVKKICKLNHLIKTKDWNFAQKNMRYIYKLAGKTLGIIGFGRIGSLFAKRAKVFGLKILVYDPYIGKDYIIKKGYDTSTLNNLLKESDFISLHLPLSKETNKFLDENKFKLMKKGTFLINVSRGGLIDEYALVKALENNCIAGAGLDVLVKEPPNNYNPIMNYFRKSDNLVITPHCAGYSEETEQNLKLKSIKEVVRFLKGKKPKCQIN